MFGVLTLCQAMAWVFADIISFNTPEETVRWVLR